MTENTKIAQNGLASLVFKCATSFNALSFFCLFIIGVLTGCSSTKIMGSALNQDRQSLAHIKNRLAFFTVNIEAKNAGSYFRLNNFWVTHETTQQRFSFPQFSNFIIGSEEVPHVIQGQRLQQTVFIDLAPGTYVVDKFALVNLSDHYKESTKEWLYHQPYPQLMITVLPDNKPQHLGQLNVTVLGTNRIGDHSQADLRITLIPPTDNQLQPLVTSYPALMNQQIINAPLAFR